MLQRKLLNTALIGLSVFATVAQAAPTGKRIETMLRSPGARELMDEEVGLWQRNLETKRLSVRNDLVMGGSVILRGVPSTAQRFNRGKLIRCDVRLIAGGQFVAERNSCDVDHPIFLPLSAPGKDQPTTVPAGYYVLGFENSIYPGFLQVKTAEQKIVDLTQVPIPAGGSVKVYRDTNSVVEEFKLYFTTYVLGQSVFRLAEYSFGDLYIKAFGTRDGAVPLTYKTCEAAKLPQMTAKGARICKAWNMGTFMMLSEMFDFKANGTFMQWEVGQQGKPYPYPMGRLLVAKRTTQEISSFVNVLPGQYVVEVTDEKGAVHATSTSVAISSALNSGSLNIGWMPAASQLKMDGDANAVKVPAAVDPAADQTVPSAAALAALDPGDGDGPVHPHETCSTAHMWRTELRAYCENDSMPGCSRSAAKVCEPMYDAP